MTHDDAGIRARERAARMAGDAVALRACDLARARCPECESCGEHVASVDDNGYCPPCAVNVLEHALAHGIAWRCSCGGIGYQDDVCPCGACEDCSGTGYSPSAARMLRRGWVECPDCEGYNTPGQFACGCEAMDPSGHECDGVCGRCADGLVECDHPGVL